VEVSTGARRRLTAPGDSVIDDAIFSHDGKKVILGLTAPIDRRPWFRSTILELDLATSSTREITTFTAGWEVRPQAFALSPSGKRLAFIGPPSEIGEGEEHNVYHYRAWMVDVAGGKARPLLPELGCAFHQGGGRSLSWTDERTLLASVLDGTQGRFLAATFDAEGQTVLEHRFLDPGCEITHEVTVSSAGPVAWIIGSDRKSPPALLRVDLDAGTSRRLTTDTSGWHLATPEDIAVKGAEGETLDGWYYRPLLTPEGEEEPSSHPLVLYYYGGSSPTTRSFNGFHQTLAANGYGVLVLNPRGAAGRGQAFADHHVADWGPKASADLLAGLDAFLATHPSVDPERIGIYGGSYGGFMTAYLASTTDRFAAAVSLYGISDLATYWGQGAWGWTYGDMSVGGAVPWENPELFVRSSPLFRAASIRTPLLLLHGEADTNVPRGESVQLFTALKVLGREVEMVLFPGEDHGIGSTFEKRVLSQRMILEWFDRWLRDDPGAWQARWSKKKEK
jgi:dipeptidyl aminopeptidase/acylaminoacyl peptidase